MRLRYVALVGALMAVACGDSPTSPSGVAEAVTWTVNGETFQASSNGMGSLRTGSNLGLIAGDCGRGASLGVLITAANLSGPGTYPVGTGAGFATVTWTPDARTGASASEQWIAPAIFKSGGGGSVTVTSITGDWVSGSFTFEVLAYPGNRDSGNKTIQGTFELSNRQRTIC